MNDFEFPKHPLMLGVTVITALVGEPPNEVPDATKEEILPIPEDARPIELLLLDQENEAPTVPLKLIGSKEIPSHFSKLDISSTVGVAFIVIGLDFILKQEPEVLYTTLYEPELEAATLILPVDGLITNPFPAENTPPLVPCIVGVKSSLF
jgi:hypothetical protein